MNNVLRLQCSRCDAERVVNPRGTLVMTGEAHKALFFSCPACDLRQWTMLPAAVRDALRGGARVVFGRRRYATFRCPDCEVAQPIPMRQLAVYPTASDELVLLWTCNVCRADRTSAAAATGTAQAILEAGGESLTAELGALIELLRQDDYQPHAALGIPAVPAHHEGDR